MALSVTLFVWYCCFARLSLAVARRLDRIHRLLNPVSSGVQLVDVQSA
jgi:hypothetical protein